MQLRYEYEYGGTYSKSIREQIYWTWRDLLEVYSSEIQKGVHEIKVTSYHKESTSFLYLVYFDSGVLIWVLIFILW